MKNEIRYATCIPLSCGMKYNTKTPGGPGGKTV